MLNSTRRSGRRSGPTGTRAAILRSARRLFAGRGFDGTSLRAVAADARVDPALVFHFYGSKDGLFAASLELPFEAGDIERVLHGPRDQLGRRVAVFYLERVFGERAATVASLLRSSVTNPKAAAMLRQTIETGAVALIARLLPAQEGELRAELVASHMIGLFLTRRIIKVEPLASESDERLLEIIAPTLQRYLTGPLPRRARRR